MLRENEALRAQRGDQLLPNAPSGTANTPYGFTGEFADASGLTFLRARYYNAYLNRFIQRDTIIPDIRNPQNLNKYAYAANNPVRFTDPSGKTPFWPPSYTTCRIHLLADGIKPELAEGACKMIPELEQEGFLEDWNDYSHVSSGSRDSRDAHRMSTAYSIVTDGISVEDVKKTPIDADGNVWYREEWELIQKSNCLDTPFTKAWIEYQVKKNASTIGSDARRTLMFNRHIPGVGRIPIPTKAGLWYVWDIGLAYEGYEIGDPKRLPNNDDFPRSKHLDGLAVDITGWANFANFWDARIKDAAEEYGLYRPFGPGTLYPEPWHFELR